MQEYPCTATPRFSETDKFMVTDYDAPRTQPEDEPSNESWQAIQTQRSATTQTAVMRQSSSTSPRRSPYLDLILVGPVAQRTNADAQLDGRSNNGLASL